MHFVKYHGLGNDYLILDPATTKGIDPVKVTPALCKPHTGLGADGVLFGPIWENGLPRVRIINPDGSEAEKSGNGLRIFSRYLVEKNYVQPPHFQIITLGGVVSVSILHQQPWSIRIDMGKATFERSQIPMTGPAGEALDEKLLVNGRELAVTCLSVGNPHCVMLRDHLEESEVHHLGPLIEHHERFPNRTNVQFVQVIDRNCIRIRIWERGAGYTLASGSSSCASARAAFAWGMVDREVTVEMPGGEIEIFIDENDHIHMTGPVVKVMEGEASAEIFSQTHD